MIVVDSSVWIDFFNGTDTAETDKLDQWLGTQPILIPDLILTEVLQGFRSDADYRRARKALSALFYADMVGEEVAIQSAENYRLLRSNGVTVRKTIDVLIATFCITHDHTLLYADRDFAPMEKHLGLVCV